VSPAGRAAPPLVTLLGRPGCHLCDEAREALTALRNQGVRFELRELNIEDDERLLAAHLERIPVIELDGEEISQLDFDPAALRSRIGSLTA
jgi:glutaredoxin